MADTMVKCKTCGRELPQKEILKHYKIEHPGATKGKAAKDEDRRPTTSTLNPVQAAIMEFVGEKLQLPMTPALIYGYFCAKRMGFEGNVGEFLTEVIDDFFQARDINYYAEVMKWEEIGKRTILDEEMKELQEKTLATGTGAR